MTASLSRVAHRDTHRGGLFRLLTIWSRRYSREPETRVQSARGAVFSAISLYAAETSAGEAALLAAEAAAELARQERLAGRRP